MSDFRRERGTRGPHVVGLGWDVKRDHRDRFKKIARDSHVSAAVLFELVVEHIETELTESGQPSWLPEKDRSQELPIDPA